VDPRLRKGNRKFHFQEIDHTICFPTAGNEKKKYANYAVVLEQIDGTLLKTEKPITLGEILDRCDFVNGYPHTVGFYKVDKEQIMLKPDYLEIRRICSVEEFWKFLNDLDM
jgi:hypothetical protein